MIVRAAPPEHYAWIRDRTGLRHSTEFRAIEALDASGEIRGMVGYDDWTPNSVQMHVAIDTPIVTRALVRPAFVYPFIEAGRKVVIGVTPSDRERALVFNKRLGFHETMRLHNGYADGVDLVFQLMTRDECRWLKGVSK